MPSEIYLDANATTPVLAAAAARARHVMETLFGNPSSTHRAGLEAKEMLAGVRATAARLLGAGAGDIVFVSGATEAIQTAVLSALCAVRARQARGEGAGRLLLYGSTEHKAVPESLAHWNQVLGLGLEIRALPVDAQGRHDLQVLRSVAGDAALVCTMAANNETGVVSDLAGIRAALDASASPALWLVDCVQALGKLPIDLAVARIDYAAFSGHKLYAPKGTGILYVREGAPFTALMAGGGQENGQRSGTENMAGIAALGSVLQALEQGDVFATHADLCRMREHLVASLQGALPGLVFNAPLDRTLPTTLNFSVPGFTSGELLDLFDAAGIRVSSGSACSAKRATPSYVLQAMGWPAWRAASAVRMSFGPASDMAFVTRASARIAECGDALRRSGRTAGAPPARAADGVQQFGQDGASSWLLRDGAHQACIVIAPRMDTLDRLRACITSQGLAVLAVLTTSTEPEPVAARRELLASLPAATPGEPAACDSTGWPVLSATLRLDDATMAPGLALGRYTLARLATPAGAAYLLGQADGHCMPALAVRFAFVQDAAPSALPEQLADVVHAGTVLCPAQDMPGALAHTFGAAQLPPAVQGAAAEPRALQSRTLEAFLRTHTNARLVDVRETFEHLVHPAPGWLGQAPEQVPLSRLVNHLEDWLQERQRPLVFICRSGARSARTAACLERLGHHSAWHLDGGISATPATA